MARFVKVTDIDGNYEIINTDEISTICNVGTSWGRRVDVVMNNGGTKGPYAFTAPQPADSFALTLADGQLAATVDGFSSS